MSDVVLVAPAALRMFALLVVLALVVTIGAGVALFGGCGAPATVRPAPVLDLPSKWAPALDCRPATSCDDPEHAR